MIYLSCKVLGIIRVNMVNPLVTKELQASEGQDPWTDRQWLPPTLRLHIHHFIAAGCIFMRIYLFIPKNKTTC